jgi:hypothetical protein
VSSRPAGMMNRHPVQLRERILVLQDHWERLFMSSDAAARVSPR